MINADQYNYYKKLVDEYEEEQRRVSKYKGYSICPFCSGSKTKPFVRLFRNQNCTDCNKNGLISNKSLVIMGLEDCIQKNED